MSNYQESTTSGTVWQRCRTVIIENPVNQVPFMSMIEQRVVDIAGNKLTSDLGTIRKDFNPTATIALRDPTTGALTGQTTTHANLYQVLYSLYMQTALERDAAQAP